MRRLFHYTSDFVYMVPLLLDDALPPEQARTLFEREPDDIKYADKLALLRLAVNRYRREASDTITLNFLLGALIKDLLHTGLTEEAVKTYREIPAEGQQEFWSPATKEPIEEEDYILRDAYYDLVIELASALVQANDPAEAKRLLSFYHDDFSKEPNSYHRGNRLRRSQRAAFVSELMEQRLNPAEIYDIFIDGYPEGSVPPPDFKDADTRMSGSSGWLWAAQQAGPAMKQQAAGYLAKAGYPGMASYLSQGHLFYQNDQAMELDTMVGLELFTPNKAGYLEKLEEARQRHASAKTGKPESEKLAIYGGPRPMLFKELPLPKKYAGTSKNDEEPTQFPKGVEPPVYPYSIVRAELHSQRWYVLFLTQQIDPAGEVSGGGYWLIRSEPGGQAWDEPLYLGLQAYFPYEILPTSKLPLIDGDTINIAVNIRELDEKSITFPPVGLQAKRRQEGLYLQFRWEDLTRDQDGDGLTDLFEHRVGMSPTNPDSDGDAIPDKEDSLPLTPFKYHDYNSKQLALALLEPIWGHEGAAHILGISENEDAVDLDNFSAAIGIDGQPFASDDTLILVADPSLFEGLHLRARVLVYDPTSIQKLDKSYGVFYAAGIQNMFKSLDGKKYYVIWSASWTGGSYRVVEENGTYKVVEESSWIS